MKREQPIEVAIVQFKNGRINKAVTLKSARAAIKQYRKAEKGKSGH